MDNVMPKIIKAWFGAAFFSFYDVHIEGVENFPLNEPTFLLMNHTCSLVDAIAALAISPKIVRLTAKDTLWNAQPWNFFVTSTGTIPIKRRQDHIHDGDNIDNTGSFEALHDSLDSNNCIGMFPEGMCAWKPNVAVLKTGAARLIIDYVTKHPDKYVYVLTCGITFIHPSKFRSAVLISYAQPIKVDKAYLDQFLSVSVGDAGEDNGVHTTNDDNPDGSNAANPPALLTRGVSQVGINTSATTKVTPPVTPTGPVAGQSLAEESAATNNNDASGTMDGSNNGHGGGDHSHDHSHQRKGDGGIGSGNISNNIKSGSGSGGKFQLLAHRLTAEIQIRIQNNTLHSKTWEISRLGLVAAQLRRDETKNNSITLAEYVHDGREWITLLENNGSDDRVAETIAQLTEYRNLLSAVGVTEAQYASSLSSSSLAIEASLALNTLAGLPLLAVAAPAVLVAAPVIALCRWQEVQQIRKGVVKNFDEVAQYKFLYVYTVLPLWVLLVAFFVAQQSGHSVTLVAAALSLWLYISSAVMERSLVNLSKAFAAFSLLFVLKKKDGDRMASLRASLLSNCAFLAHKYNVKRYFAAFASCKGHTRKHPDEWNKVLRLRALERGEEPTRW